MTLPFRLILHWIRLTPNHIRESAKKAIDGGLTHYEPNIGMLELREAIADKYKRELDYKCTTDNIMITIGGTEANYLTLITIINPGDEVIITNPHYPPYFGHITLVGGKVVFVPIYEENGFKLMSDDFEKAITPKTKAIFINYPNNPVGTILTKEDFEALAKVIKKYDLMVISDEVYEKIYFDGYTHFSMSQIPEVRNNVFVTNSFSKTYAMTGWRIGYIVGNKKYISQMQKIQEGIVSCVPGFIQKAAIDAINGSQDVVGQMVVDYTRRRDILIDGINKIPGFKCIKSSGSIYAFPNIKSFGKKSVDFAMDLLKEAGVVTVPGSAFGNMGEGYLRFSFANSDENLKEGIRRIAEHVKKKY